MASREQRAARRRTEWTAEVVSHAQPKGRLYDPLLLEQRLAAFIRLNARAWAAAHGPTPAATPRSEWPGELFEIQRRG